tara:strand:+ start:423 stop:2084 length:1662 start_codon:yes stop_codon:yes gene_type:complete
MGQCLDKVAHSCGTSSALQVFEREDGTVDGYCYSCDTYVRHPYGGEKALGDIPKKRRTGLTDEEIATKIAEIQALGSMDLRDRRIRKDALDQFGIKIGLSEQDGKTPAFHHYPYTKDGVLSAYKTRLIEGKRMWSVGDQSNVDLFGWEQAIATGARRLIIVEGELDAASLWKMLDLHTSEQYKDHMPAVCSLPHGAGSAGKDLARLAVKIRKHFKQISFCFDDDKAGVLATEEACKVMPEATTIALPSKDANDCLVKGQGKAACKAATFNAQAPKNTRLVWGREIHEEAKVAAEWGLSFPWDALTQITRGMRFGETYYIAAGEKMGKSEVVNALAEHCITEHGLKVLLAKPEESNNKTYKLLNSKVTGNIFHDPKIAFNEDAYEAGGKKIMDNVCMLNLYQHIGWDTLKGDIRAAAAMDVKVVVIDPITNLTNGMSNSDIDSHLKGVAQEAAAMAMDLDIIIFFFCHLNKPTKGSTPWDRGGKITTDYFAGSSAMARSCNYAIGMEGNKDPDLPEEERNVRKLVVLADREFGESGFVNLFWDVKTGLFNEMRY